MLLPLITALGFWLGGQLTAPLSQSHPTVRLAERIAAEDTGKVTGTTDESAAFRQTGKPVAELTAHALRVRGQFAIGAHLLGAFIGLVFGAKLLSLAISRPNTTYEPDQGDCVSCGRCYKYCPKEISRVKKMSRKPAAVPVPVNPM